MRRHLIPLGLWALIGISLAGAVGLGLTLYAMKIPYKGYLSASVLVRIPPGSTTLSILESLENGGVISDRRLGLIALKLFHRGKSLKAGEYRFAGERSAEEVILSIVAGDVVTYRVTVPEGFTSDEVFALFSSQGFGSEKQFRSLFQRPREFEGVPPEAPTLEGFLFPDTYTVTRSLTTREILALLVRQFRHRLPEGYEAATRSRGLSLLESVTVASIVEKETSVSEERPMVSAVYQNRLRKGMLLQCDPTTIYALKRSGLWRGALYRSDLAIPDAYNTYANPGLPPGPICNPGLRSLRAAVNPAAVNYIYFVAAGDGSHRFALEYEEQQKNVLRYHEARRASRGDE